VSRDPVTEPSPLVPTILLAAATGARSMTGVAVAARSLAGAASSEPPVQPARFLADSRVAAAATTLAAMELAADKLPGIPNRTDPGPLVGRVVAGGLIGAAVAAVRGRDRAFGALVGAAAAFAGAHLSFQLRRELAELLPPALAALVEDAAVGAVAAAGASAIPRPQSLRGASAGR
jgi:uncharacterized membrane protein